MSDSHVCVLPRVKHAPSLARVTCRHCQQKWALGYYVPDDRGDDYERFGWHRVGGDQTDDNYREVFSWRYNPAVNRVFNRVHCAQAWWTLVRAAALGEPVIAGVCIRGAKLSASDPIVVGRDVTIDRCDIAAQIYIAGPHAVITSNYLRMPAGSGGEQ
jgi:hypothetical protein